MTESNHTFQNLPSYFTGKIVVTTVTKEKTLDSLGKMVGISETETVTTYEHINADYNLIPTR